MNIKYDKKRDWWKCDIEDVLQKAKSAYFSKQYEWVAGLCGNAVNALILDLYMRMLPLVRSPKERLELVTIESAIGDMQRYTLGATIALSKKAKLFEKAEEIFGIDLGEAKALDYSLIVHTRNMAANSMAFKDANAVGAVLFQTQTLYQVLKMISAETAIIEKAVQEGAASVSIDHIEYLNSKVISLQKKIEEINGVESDALLRIAGSIRESIEITRINQEDALFKLRKILEQICAEIYRRDGGNPSGRMLDWLMTKLSERGLIPKKVFKHMTTIKSFGNAGAHPSGEKYEIQDFEAVFISLIVVVDWYMDKTT